MIIVCLYVVQCVDCVGSGCSGGVVYGILILKFDRKICGGLKGIVIQKI